MTDETHCSAPTRDGPPCGLPTGHEGRHRLPSSAQPSETAALRARVAALEEQEAGRKRLGKPPRRAYTSDARLVARLLARGWSKVALLKALGYSERSGALSRCNGPKPGTKGPAAVPLTAETRAKLRGMLAEKESTDGGKKVLAVG